VPDLAARAARADAFLTRRLAPDRVATAPSWSTSEIRSLWDELRSADCPRVNPAGADWRDSRAEIVQLFSLAGRILVPLPLRELAIFTPLLRALAPGLPDSLADGSFAVVAAPTVDHGTPRLEGGTLTAVCDLVPFADAASAFVVPVRGDDGLVVSVIDAAVPGITLEPRSTYDVCSRPTLVSFDAAPAMAVLDRAAAETWWTQITLAGRLAVAAETSGALASSCAQAVEYARDRAQFGRPIGSFQAVQHLLAGIASKAYTLEALCEEAAACTPDAAHGLATSAKAYAAEIGLEVVEGALQAHGAIGYTQERPLHLYLKRVITLNATLGAARELRREIGMQRLAAAGVQ
jgi:hypothetical protein